MVSSYQAPRVLENQYLGGNIYRLRVEHQACPAIRSGQFYMLRGSVATFVARPISVFDADEHSVSFLYAVVGAGTQALSELAVGDTLSLMGRLGNGFTLPTVQDEGDQPQVQETRSMRVALVGGGIGIAPLYHWSKVLRATGHQVEVFLGFRDQVYCVEEFKAVCDTLHLATEDGSVGTRGYVTDIPELYTGFDAVYVCGPTPMMRVLQALELAPHVYLSLEKKMACGVGLCIGCQVATKHQGNQRICYEGPVFKATEVILP